MTVWRMRRRNAGRPVELEAARFSEVSPARGNGFVALDFSRRKCAAFASLELARDEGHTSRMDRDTVIATLRAHEAELRAEGISHVYLFGSIARGEADEKSDVDLFYDYDSDRFGFLQFMRIREIAPEIFGRAVDIMPRKGIHPLIRDEVVAEAIQVF